MKAIKFSILLYAVIFSATACFASPSFYITTRGSEGGLFKLNTATKQAERIDTYPSDHDFTGLHQYGDNQLLVASYRGTNGIMIFNQDGSLATQYATSGASIDAVEKPNSRGDIYYTSYITMRVTLLDIDTYSTTTVLDAPYNYARKMAMRSDGELYVTTWSHNRLVQVSTGTVISTSNSPFFLEADNQNNLYKNNGYNIIQKIDDSHSTSTFWQNTNISMYNFSYYSDEAVFYGLGQDLTTGYFNIYQFDLLGNASLYLQNISGLTGGLDGHLTEYQSNITIINDGITTTIPEPASLILLAVGFIGLLKRYIISNR